jgi:hypothetical protein
MGSILLFNFQWFTSIFSLIIDGLMVYALIKLLSGIKKKKTQN